LAQEAARFAGLSSREISMLAVGVAAPLLAVPLLLLWLGRRLTSEELAATIIRTLAVGCRDQNPRRTREKWRRLS